MLPNNQPNLEAIDAEALRLRVDQLQSANADLIRYRDKAEARVAELVAERDGWRHEREMTLTAFRHVRDGGDPALIGHPSGSEFGDALREMLKAVLAPAEAISESRRVALEAELGELDGGVQNTPNDRRHCPCCGAVQNRYGKIAHIVTCKSFDLRKLVAATGSSALAELKRSVRVETLRTLILDDVFIETSFERGVQRLLIAKLEAKAVEIETEVDDATK